MNIPPRKVKLSLISIMLILVVAIGLFHAQVACAFGFCESCQEQCRTEGAQIFLQCREQGKDVNTCLEQNWQYNNTCNSTFCSGCGPIHD